ncbi:DinB family protein [Paenibacillus sp. GCM10023248]|uniref:DinB family protein n=1 Tax=Bacillales TaxID=1385 RepID=UPI0023796E01|nr:MULTISPECIES: DinB family protein [Bacillales]MDD9269308.1 DinB family protein [Paenibacillus sp. MAHUQ-63]MDR6880468.1 putative damage-inducible protein DinB [Bacillus sp. 3255]
MYTSVNAFLEDSRQEAELTLKVLDKLTDDSLMQAVSEAQPRTLGELAWHLVGSYGAFLRAASLQMEGPDLSKQPASAAEITKTYRKVYDIVSSALKEQWTDAKLLEKLVLFGFIETTYGGVLQILIRHQIHHRGQMTILMRQAGLAAPGIYGPNEEETAAMRAARANN